jgi:predicted O-methyltransferase YrrM
MSDAQPVPDRGTPPKTFEEALALVQEVGGWLTSGQARRLWERARRVQPPRSIVEIGSFQGKSTIILGSAAPPAVPVVAIDPHAGTDRGPDEIRGYEAEGADDHERFLANLARAGLSDRVRHLRLRSAEAVRSVPGEIGLLYIDGAHRFQPALSDIKTWGDKVPHGGTMLIHDNFSAVGVTLATGRHLFFSKRWHYVGRSGSMTEYVKRSTGYGPRGRLKNAGRQAAQLPYFGRNLVVKGMIKAGLGEHTKKLGNEDGTWPY